MLINKRPEYASKPPPLTCGLETTVLAASKMMAAKNFGSIVVLDKQSKLLGLMTERDIFRRVVAEELNPAETAVKDVMSSELRTAKSTDDLSDWLRIMSNERFRRLPILDDDGRVIAVMSQGDFVSYTWPQLINQAKTFAKESVVKNNQQVLIIGAILVYALISLIVVARAVG